MGRVHRSKLLNAPYNPRHLDEAGRKRLKAVIKKHGLLEPLVWNKRTGHLVGGHQRIAQLDALEKSPDYELDVAVVDLSEKQEAEANVLLNNPSIQGEYDVDLLKGLGDEHGLDFKNLGFTEADLDLMFDGELADLLEDSEDVKKAKDTLKDIKAERADAKEKFKDQHCAEYYFVVVCEDNSEKERLLRKFGAPVYETYIGAHMVRRAMGDDSEPPKSDRGE